MNNTDKSYPCTMCGSEGNIVREGVNPRLKCNKCNFMYDASDSLAMVEQGSVPDGPPEIVDSTAVEVSPTQTKLIKKLLQTQESNKLPRTLSYVIVSKNREDYQFCNSRDIKKIVLQWTASGKTFDVFELLPKVVSATIEIK